MNVREVLIEGGRLFRAGLAAAFPWVLAAELLQLLPPFADLGGILDVDLDRFSDPVFLVRLVLLGCLQAFLYGVAIGRLAQLAGDAVEVPWHRALRNVPAIFAGYVIYEVLVVVGLVISVGFFALGDFILGPLGGLLLCCLPLAPTAWASTAFALFIFPASLERQGAFAALGESRRLVTRHWARASLVISVPALALLALSLAQDAKVLSTTVSDLLNMASGLSTEGSSNGLQALLASVQAGDKAPMAFLPRLGLAFAGGVIWWYALAACYAEYRELARRRPA